MNERGKTALWVVAVFAVLSIFAWLSGGLEKREAMTTPAAAPEPVHQHFDSYAAAVAAGRIDPSVNYVYTRDQFPRTFKEWGASWVKRIGKLREAGALMAANAESCDRVYGSELADGRGVVRQSPVVFVDCDNGARFYFSEADIKTALPARSEVEKAASLSDVEARRICSERLRAGLRFPSSYNPSFGGAGVYHAPTTGNVAVTVDFEAKNGMGNVLPQRGKCYFREGLFNSVEITDR